MTPKPPSPSAGRPRDRVDAAARVRLSPGARELLLRVREKCDQNCLFCGADPKVEPTVQDPGKLARIVSERPPEDRALVVISGGEPTLDDELPDRVAAVAEAGAGTIMIQSNGMRLTEPALLDALLPYRDRMLFLVSLHAHHSDVADVISRYRGGWERTLAGIDAVLATGHTVWVNHVLNTLNFFDAAPFVAFLDERFPELSMLVFSFVTPTYRARRNAWLIPPLDAVSPHLVDALDEARRRGLATAVSENCGVPLCVVPGHEASHDATYATPQGPRPPALGRTKPPACTRCRWNDRCTGVWEGYAARHGARGLVPK